MTPTYVAQAIPVVLTTDCGTEMDDQWALAHLHLSPSLDLRAVVSTHAPNLTPPAADSSAAACREVLGRLPGGDAVPVLPGSSEPLPDCRTPLPNAGVERILEEARRVAPSETADGGPRARLIVLAIGAATDLASALLLAPDIAASIEIVAMGFQSREHGGDEWNVKNDPCAWRVLLSSSAPLTVGSAAVCKEHLCLTAAAAAAMLSSAGRAGRYLSDLMAGWLAANAEIARVVTGRPDLWPVWDEIVVAHLLGLTQWAETPRPILQDDLAFAESHDGASMRWITQVDARALWQDLVVRCLGT